MGTQVNTQPNEKTKANNQPKSGKDPTSSGRA